MTVLSAQSIRKHIKIEPFTERIRINGMSLGLSAAGYDVSIAEYASLFPGEFALASIQQHITMPDNIIGFVHDKSTLARKGIAVQNTVIEPGWRGYLTIELTNHSRTPIRFDPGCPIAQIVFHWLDAPTLIPYSGKYQNQEAGPQAARFE